MQRSIEETPKITVVTPSYNQGAYLKETLGSIVAQNYPNVEIIVIDGGSTDDSKEVIESFSEHIAYWVSEPDKGQSHAINKGFAEATGDVLCWLNSDDVFLPGALNTVAQAFIAHPDWNWVTAPTLKFGEGFDVHEGIYKLPGSRAEWLVNCPISQPSTFWRRSLYDQLGGLDESFHYVMDFEYWLRLVFAGERPRWISRPLSAYRLHDVSKTVSQAEKFRIEEVRMRDLYVGKLDGRERSSLEKMLRDREALLELGAAVLLLGAARWDEAKERARAVFRSKPFLLLTRTGLASALRIWTRRPRQPKS
ncbi:MAG TPA: glycosyltransferase family 2 protein [Fimbriimonadaceae bacterium]|nr:glycosyltransferase family 2 protein [Fimbriimonadaceae bacterium]